MFKTREIYIGNIPLGADNPVRVQTMTNTIASDIAGTAEQIIRIYNTGADYVRISTPSVKDAESIRDIKTILDGKGIIIPLIADIHFNPLVAVAAARYADKIRINPGNLIPAGKQLWSETGRNHKERELKAIRDVLNPIIRECKKYNTAIRIGVNHGSLSKRILYYFGNTALGMVESGMEFLRICEDLDFHNLVVSVKSSHVRVMVDAARELNRRMMAEGLNYPQHLGVTEAGEGEDGRIKSATGIACLLKEGIGDTVRISLTEPPENEIPVAREIVDRCSPRRYFVPGERLMKKTRSGQGQKPIVICDADDFNEFIFSNKDLEIKSPSPDYIYVGSGKMPEEIPSGTKVIADFKIRLKDKGNCSVMTALEYRSAGNQTEGLIFVLCRENEETGVISSNNSIRLVKEYSECRKTGECKDGDILLYEPVNTDHSMFSVRAACDLGPCFVRNEAGGIWIRSRNKSESGKLLQTSFHILQAAEARYFFTEFISCPTCARTTSDVGKAVQLLKEKVGIMGGIKIAVMGCIVNGPGEMADADFGYVGMGKGKVNLYRKGILVEKNIPEDEAVDRLIEMIQA
ncbi:MAG: (E)-4-hydroxy-3-methylbut-2-enyl-diphosphate synthase [Bacteroidota bacterium]